VTYPVVDVSAWEVLGFEPMGSKPGKIWLAVSPGLHVAEGRWLFKPTTTQVEHDRQFLKGDDWAEKIASETATLLGVPAAPVELAIRHDQLGIISGDVSAGWELVLGNEVLHGQDPDYDRGRRRGVPGYTIEAVFAALRSLDVSPPTGSPDVDASLVFAGYLLLDALVANTDRHHENWGVLVDPNGEERTQLARTFDHASCLGFQLSDDERAEHLQTNDANRTVGAYAARGRSRHFAAGPSLVDLAVEAIAACGHEARSDFRARLQKMDDEHLAAVAAAVPVGRMSQPSRMFSTRLMGENRRRLLNELERAD